MLDAVLLNMRAHGRIAVCGMVSQHSNHDKAGIHNLFTLIRNRVTMKGFLQSDYLHLFPEFVKRVGDHYKKERLSTLKD